MEKHSYNLMEAAKEVGCTVGTLTWYEKKHPELRPETFANGVRVYSPQDIEVAKEIHTRHR